MSEYRAAGAGNTGGQSGPLVTIVITSYNYGAYVADAIRSALAQTYRHIEVLILDNASTDNSLEVIRSFDDARIRVIARPENVGIQRNHNDAIKEARGDYVVFLSADDMLLPCLIDDVLAFRARHPAVDIVYGSVVIVDKDSRFTEYFEHPQFDFANSYSYRNEFANLLTRDSCMYLPTVLFPRSIFDELGLLDESLSVILDYEYDIRMAAAGKSFAFLAKPLALIRFHGENRSGAGAFVKSGGQLREFCTLLERYTQPKYHNGLVGYRTELQAMVERKVEEIRSQYPAEFASMQNELQPYVDRARRSVAQVPLVSTEVTEGRGLISVVVPFSGRVPALQRALSSLAKQTYRHWEALVVSDGAPDPEGLIEWIGLQDRVRVTAMRRAGRGPGAARNAALHGLRGEIVVYLDDDDTFSYEYFAAIARAFSDPTVHATLARWKLAAIGADGEMAAESPWHFASGSPGKASWISNVVPLGAVAHRRFCLASAGYFRTELQALEDWDFLIRLTYGYPLSAIGVDGCTIGLDRSLSGQYVFGRRTSSEWTAYASAVQQIYQWYPARDAGETAARSAFLQSLQGIVQRGLNGIGNPSEVIEFARSLAGITGPEMLRV